MTLFLVAGVMGSFRGLGPEFSAPKSFNVIISPELIWRPPCRRGIPGPAGEWEEGSLAWFALRGADDPAMLDISP